MAELNLTQEWDKVFPKSEKVNHRKVTFHNRYGITLAADLYTYKDMVRLHEIMSLKSLGFSLDDIKENLSSLETPEEAAETLARQEEKLKAEIERLTRSLKDMEALK